MTKFDKVIAILKELGIPADINEFDSRLIIQKTVCLLQLRGISIGYPFSMYIHGPYSPELTSDYFLEKEKLQTGETDTELTETERDILKKFSEIFNHEKPSQLEISSTYAHFTNTLYYSSIDAIKATRELKSQYSQGQIAVAISKANQFLYSPTPDDLQILREETTEWQHIGFHSLEWAE
ncbi:hypothetical protein [Methanospirillum hungatei]|uniref:hypothetical protein n=1 Tax=Methanospirillum hungatei TaxID=2203 RepID=UPI0026ED97D2|nr:hypothetical protein [Methanospirillum hungatei]MCA1917308.1 hypothetical protein [Methanospirillum hungatei]